MAYNTGYMAEHEISLEQEICTTEESPIFEGEVNVINHPKRPRIDSLNLSQTTQLLFIVQIS